MHWRCSMRQFRNLWASPVYAAIAPLWTRRHRTCMISPPMTCLHRILHTTHSKTTRHRCGPRIPDGDLQEHNAIAHAKKATVPKPLTQKRCDLRLAAQVDIRVNDPRVRRVRDTVLDSAAGVLDFAQCVRWNPAQLLDELHHLQRLHAHCCDHLQPHTLHLPVRFFRSSILECAPACVSSLRVVSRHLQMWRAPHCVLHWSSVWGTQNPLKRMHAPRQDPSQTHVAFGVAMPLKPYTTRHIVRNAIVEIFVCICL